MMRSLFAFVCLALTLALISLAPAQPPGPRGTDSRGGSSKTDATSFVQRMLIFDTNHDGQLSRDEITDNRLEPLMIRADGNHDGIVTQEELTTIFGSEYGNNRRPSDREGPGGPPGSDRRGGPRFGEILPPHVKDMLNLSSAQLKKLDALQKQVDSKLEQILTEEQNQQLAELRSRGPGGPDGELRRQGPPGGRPNDGAPPRRPTE